MKCPKNTAVCKVRKVQESNETFGSPPTSCRVLYECKAHGYFIHHVDKNAVSVCFDERPDLD